MSERTIIQRMFGLNRGAPSADLKRQHMQTGEARVIRVSDEDGVEPEVSKAPGLAQWQELVLKYADKVPILSSGARWYEENTKRVRFFLADEETGDGLEGASQADEAIDILNAAIEEIARAVGLRYLIGESRHTFDRSTKALETRGAGELFYKGGRYVLKDREGREKDLDSAYDVWRSYDPDRKWSDLATSSHKPMLDVFEAFVIAYAEERAVSIRLALNTGVIGISEEVFAVGGQEDSVGSEGSDQGAALEARFQQMLGMTIRNPRDAASFVPPVLVTPAGQKVSDVIQHVSIAAERDKRKVAERIDMLKEEFAVGTDLPADIAKGFMADMNHWNVWAVDENAYKNYLAPKIQSTVHDAFEEIALALGIDVTGLTVGIDASQLVSPKDMSETAGEAFDRKAISAVAYRKYAGFTEEDAPDAEEQRERETVEPAEADDGEDGGDEEVTGGEGEGVTAAAATDGEPDLGRLNLDLTRARYNFERELRDAVEQAAEEFVDADGRIVAAADPDAPDPIERVAAAIALVIRKGFEGIGLAAARGLATRRAQDWLALHESRIETLGERAGYSGASLILGWLTSKQATSIPGRAAYGIARSIESVAAGGPPSMNNNGDPTEGRPKVLLEDADFLRLLEEEGRARPVYEWEHGTPPQPFAPHVALDGTTWTGDQEGVVLANPLPFPPSAIYHPGDHDGCTCRYDVEFERII